MTTSRRYRVRHETIYHYGGDVAHSHQLLHLTPRAFEHQLCHAHSLTLQPTPSTRRDDLDAFGNTVTRLEYDRPHDRLEVLAEVQVEVRVPEPVAAQTSRPWEEVRHSLTYPANQLSPECLDASRFRMESAFVRIKQIFTDYAADCFPARTPILVGAEALMHKMYADFRYAPGTTDVKTSIVDAFEARRGVCQDFAHIMIACLRARGLAARYVSGYLRTLPADQTDASLLGGDASHAWVSVFCPPLGWIGLDPTNDVRVAGDHITIAWGRDFGDVSPLRGVIVGGGRHRLSVRVWVQPE